MPLQRNTLAHLEFTRHVVSGRDLDNTAARRCGIEGGLDGRRIIGDAVAHRAERRNIKQIGHDQILHKVVIQSLMKF